MAVAFDRVKPGDVLYQVKRKKMGNVNVSRWAHSEVRIISIDVAKRTAVVSWNGTARREWHERDIRTLHRTVPKHVRDAEARR